MSSLPSPSQEDSSHENLSEEPQQANESSSSSPSTSNECVPEVSEVGNSPTDETHQSRNLTAVTIQDQRILPQTVRDANQPNGQADADQTYNMLFEGYYPNYKDRVYRVPPVHIGSLNSKQTKSEQTKSLQNDTRCQFQIYGKFHTVGDEAEAHVSNSIENLLKHWVHDKQPAFIITSFKFENFCNRTSFKPQSDENRHTAISTGENALTAERRIDGEHDILIIHYNVGMIGIQVKGCESQKDPNASVKEAIKQLNKDRNFIKANFEDLNTDVSFTPIVALPSISLEELKGKTYACTRIHNLNNCEKDCQEECLQRCLLREDCERETDKGAVSGCRKTNLCEWWNRITKDCKGFKSFDDYKRVVARYIGFKSTVPIRNLSESVREMGNRCMNIVLTQQQIQVLRSSVKRLVIHGEYGSGKTVLLILKARILLWQPNLVCIISMGHSPLIRVLEDSVKYDMDVTMCQDQNKVMFRQCESQDELKQILRDSKEENRHVLVDEFPSYVALDEDLKMIIKDYPSHLTLWCIMSREREEACLTKGLQDVSLSFERVFLGKVLRCPQYVLKYLTTRPQNPLEILRYPKNKEITTTISKEKMAKHFGTLGLPTNDVKVHVCPNQKIRWSDIVVIVDDAHKHKEHCFSFLENLGIPLTTLTDANAFIREDAVLFVSENESPGFVRKEVIYFEPDKIVANPKMCEFQGGLKAKHIDHTEHEGTGLQECDACKREFNCILIELGLEVPQPEKRTTPHATLMPSTQSKSQVQAGAAGMSQNLLAQAKSPNQKLSYSDMVILDERPDPQCPTKLFSMCKVPVLDRLDVDRLCDEEAYGSDTQVLYMKPRLFQGLERKIVVIITSEDPPDRCPLENDEIVDHIELALTRCSSQLIIVHT